MAQQANATVVVRAMGFALLAAILFAASARESLAACGDYVMVGSHHHARPDGRDSHRAALPPASPSSPGSHCEGPTCQRQMPLPADPWRHVPKLISHDLACLLTTDDALNACVRWIAVGQTPRPLDGWPSDIEHPPRRVDYGTAAQIG